jgi:hypothetical protein
MAKRASIDSLVMCSSPSALTFIFCAVNHPKTRARRESLQRIDRLPDLVLTGPACDSDDSENSEDSEDDGEFDESEGVTFNKQASATKESEDSPSRHQSEDQACDSDDSAISKDSVESEDEVEVDESEGVNPLKCALFVSTIRNEQSQYSKHEHKQREHSLMMLTWLLTRLLTRVSTAVKTLHLSNPRNSAVSKCFMSAAAYCNPSYAIGSNRFSMLLAAPPPTKATRFASPAWSSTPRR